MVSHYLLPYILHATRVTDHSATVIDNIFPNNTSYESISGNIISQICDHFSQFMILNKAIAHYKTCSYAMTFPILMKKNLSMGFLTLVWNFYMILIHHSLNSTAGMFIQTVLEYVDDHASLGKMNKKDLKLQSKPWVN